MNLCICLCVPPNSILRSQEAGTTFNITRFVLFVLFLLDLVWCWYTVDALKMGAWILRIYWSRAEIQSASSLLCPFHDIQLRSEASRMFYAY